MLVRADRARGGSDVAGIRTTATRYGDEYVLRGAKTFITNAGYATWTVIFATTDKSAGRRGLSAFIVPMDASGVVIEKHLTKMGQRASNTAAFGLEDVIVPAANRLGLEGDGFRIAMTTLDMTRATSASGAVGVARAAYEHAKRYAVERVQFGQPIAANQGVSFSIVDMATKIEAARLPDLAGGVDGRRGGPSSGHCVLGDGQTLCRGHRDGGHNRRRSGLRWIWLHDGVPGGEADARCQPPPDLRRLVADPARRPGPGASDVAADPRR